MQKILTIEGMTCRHCVARVESALKAIPGVEAKVDLQAKTATVISEEDIANDTLKKTVENAGYSVTKIK